MKLNWNKFLMEEAGAASGGSSGATGANSLLTTPPGGGGAAAATGNAGAASGAASGNAPAGNANAGGAPAGQTANNWRSQLPQELQDEPSLKIFNDIPALAKSFIHAQRAIGADKLVVPGKHATDDDWQQAFQKLGLPKELKDYEIKLGESASIDKDFVAKFKENAHKAGILPQQAQKLADWFSETNKASEAEVVKVREAKIKSDLDGLKSEWGAAYDQKLGKAQQTIREMNDPGLVKYLDESGLGNDPQLIKLLAGVAEKFMKEDTEVGGKAGLKTKYTPKEAMVEANKLMMDMKGPYHDKNHPNHKAAVTEVQELFAMANPS